MEREKNFISAVVYLCNDEREVLPFVAMLDDTLAANFEKYELIFVNDASADNSVAKLKQYANSAAKAAITIINMSFSQGVEAAMNAGVDLAIGDFVFEFDSLSDDFESAEIMSVYNTCLSGYDIVSATSSGKKKSSSGLFYNLFNSSSRLQNKIGTETFRILSRRAINRVHSLSTTIPYRKALYANSGLKMKNLVYKATKNISSKPQSEKNRQTLALDSLILFTDIAYKASFSLSVLLMAGAIFTAVYSLSTFLVKAVTPEGWTTTMLFLCGAFFGVFAILTIIIKYLSVLVNLIFSKQRYLIEGVEKVSKK